MISRTIPCLRLTLWLLPGVIVPSAIGYFTPEFYYQEMPQWQVQSVGQDLIDLLLIAPALLLSGWLAYRGSRLAFIIWGGVNMYVLYTFIIFCFSVHFNHLFLVYCFNLGLSGYATVFFFTEMQKIPLLQFEQGRSLRRSVGFYFQILAIGFASLWLSQIAGWMNEDWPPKALEEVGLLTNPVHVLDLSLFLPFIFITGRKLWRSQRFAILTSPSLLTFFILMNITIATLNEMMRPGTSGMPDALTIGMLLLTVLSLVFLFLYAKMLKDQWSHDNIEKLSGAQ